MLTGTGRLKTPGWATIDFSMQDASALVPSHFVIGPPTAAVLNPDTFTDPWPGGGTAVADAISDVTSARSAGSWVSDKLGHAALGDLGIVVKVEFAIENLDLNKLLERPAVFEALKRELAQCVSRRLKVRPNAVAVQLQGDEVQISIGIFCGDMARAEELLKLIDEEGDELKREMLEYLNRILVMPVPETGSYGLSQQQLELQMDCCKGPGGLRISALQASVMFPPVAKGIQEDHLKNMADDLVIEALNQGGTPEVQSVVPAASGSSVVLSHRSVSLVEEPSQELPTVVDEGFIEDVLGGDTLEAALVEDAIALAEQTSQQASPPGSLVGNMVSGVMVEVKGDVSPTVASTQGADEYAKTFARQTLDNAQEMMSPPGGSVVGDSTQGGSAVAESFVQKNAEQCTGPGIRDWSRFQCIRYAHWCLP
jgi:hypothetical protein